MRADGPDPNCDCDLCEASRQIHLGPPADCSRCKCRFFRAQDVAMVGTMGALHDEHAKLVDYVKSVRAQVRDLVDRLNRNN